MPLISDCHLQLFQSILIRLILLVTEKTLSPATFFHKCSRCGWVRWRDLNPQPVRVIFSALPSNFEDGRTRAALSC